MKRIIVMNGSQLVQEFCDSTWKTLAVKPAGNLAKGIYPA